MSSFPPTTDLIVGPDAKKTFMGDGKGNSALGGILPRDAKKVSSILPPSSTAENAISSWISSLETLESHGVERHSSISLVDTIFKSRGFRTMALCPYYDPQLSINNPSAETTKLARSNHADQK